MKIRNIAALMLIFVCIQGCAAKVKPWERGVLSKPEMAWAPNAMEAQLESHIFFSKEASTGGGEAVGGGCGCN